MKKYMLALSVLLTTVAAACGSDDTTDLRAETPALRAETSSIATPALLLRTVENIGVELDLRLASGTITAEWAKVWSDAQTIREQSQIKSLITLIDKGASSDELLTVGSETMEAYFQSYEPVFRQMEQQYANGTLDARLTELRSIWLSTSEQVANSGDSAQRASTWCCRARTVFSGNFKCHQFKTAGVWAVAKCSAFFAGVPIVDGIRWSKDSCSNITECR